MNLGLAILVAAHTLGFVGTLFTSNWVGLLWVISSAAWCYNSNSK